MPPKKEEKRIPMVAQLQVTSAEGVETIRTFDRAWHRAFELPTPVNIKFIQFVRAD